MQVKDLKLILDSCPPDAEIITNAPDGTQPFVWVGLIDGIEYASTGVNKCVFFEYHAMPFANELRKAEITRIWP